MALKLTSCVAEYACFAYSATMTALKDPFIVREATSSHRLAKSLTPMDVTRIHLLSLGLSADAALSKPVTRSEDILRSLKWNRGLLLGQYVAFQGVVSTVGPRSEYFLPSLLPCVVSPSWQGQEK